MRQTREPTISRRPPEEPVRYRMSAEVEFLAKSRMADGYDARGIAIQNAVRRALRTALAEEFSAGRLDLPYVTVEFEMFEIEEEQAYEEAPDWQYEYNSGD